MMDLGKVREVLAKRQAIIAQAFHELENIQDARIKIGEVNDRIRETQERLTKQGLERTSHQERIAVNEESIKQTLRELRIKI